MDSPNPSPNLVDVERRHAVERAQRRQQRPAALEAQGRYSAGAERVESEEEAEHDRLCVALLARARVRARSRGLGIRIGLGLGLGSGLGLGLGFVSA